MEHTAHRIDVHQHAVPPEIAEAMRAAGAPFVPAWSLTETWRVLAENKIAAGLVSNPVPGGFLHGARQAAGFVRAANEASAELVREYPARFGLLAALPMPHVDAALAELAHAYDVLGADGVVLIPQAEGRYLGSGEHDPVFAELDRRGAVVLVHPMMLPGGPVADPPSVLADFLLDTTRGALSLMLAEVPDRYPRIRFVLAHAGGFLPYAAARIGALGGQFFGLSPARLRDYLGRFHYDLALSAPSALPSLLAAVPPERVLFGTDWCAVPPELVAANTEGYRRAPGLDERARALIDRDNALRLFPALARRLDPSA
ncbi:amidohydrolase [Crossiella sp. SN42]|uniref:amidohydrolase family protein n=1 Tax=Crossiella sp. SN42 TaxID=2944808 RepID=UPI00207D2D50|nr:amidohydrolase family protein [Crossiella sp. SN42]MCO1580324.1 amidohydrolase [Crossiella sp. SN42]